MTLEASVRDYGRWVIYVSHEGAKRVDCTLMRIKNDSTAYCRFGHNDSSIQVCHVRDLEWPTGQSPREQRMEEEGVTEQEMHEGRIEWPRE